MILDLSGTSKRFLPDKSSIISCDKDFWISPGNPEVEHSSQSKTDFRVPEKSSLSPPWWVLGHTAGRPKDDFQEMPAVGDQERDRGRSPPWRIEGSRHRGPKDLEPMTHCQPTSKIEYFLVIYFSIYFFSFNFIFFKISNDKII